MTGAGADADKTTDEVAAAAALAGNAAAIAIAKIRHTAVEAIAQPDRRLVKRDPPEIGNVRAFRNFPPRGSG